MYVIRNLTVYVGSNILFTSLIVTLFLISLTLGYFIGSKGGLFKRSFEVNLFLNFFISSVLIFFLSDYFMEYFFNVVTLNSYVAVLIYVLIFMCPLVFLIGQTIPIISNKINANSVGEAAGFALFLNTAGSVLGGLVTTFVFFYYVGVSNTFYIMSATLILLSYIAFNLLKKSDHVFYKKAKYSFVVIPLTIMFLVFHFSEKNNSVVLDNAYAKYEVYDLSSGYRVFSSNKSYSSLFNKESSGYSFYINYLRMIMDGLEIKNNNVLVLGAGGFTLSHNDKLNNKYTYVDIDPEIIDVAQKYFLNEKINGEFIVDDARKFLSENAKNNGVNYDAIVIDLYSHKSSVPWHTTTVEFMNDVKNNLKKNGYAIFNIIVDKHLKEDFSKYIHNTITSSFNYCYSIPFFIEGVNYVNIEYVCRNDDEGLKILSDNNTVSDILQGLSKKNL